MWACLFPSYTAPSAPQQAARKAASPSAAKGRAWTTAAPGSPRISHRSTWWQVLGSGSVKNLIYWVERKILDSRLPRTARAQNPENARIALQQALKSTFKTNSPQEEKAARTKLETSLENAIWYGVDIENVAREVYSAANAGERFSMQTSCQATTALAILSDCLADSHLAHENLKRQLRIGFLKSNEYSQASAGFDSAVQQTLWSQMDLAFRAACPGLRSELIDQVLQGSDKNELLFLATHHYMGCSGKLSVLQALSARAFFLLEKQLENKNVKDIRLTAANDTELDAFGKLAGCYNFRKLKAAQETEKQHRTTFNARTELFESFRKHLIQAGSPGDDGTRQRFLSTNKSASACFSTAEQKAILRKAIAASDPATIVKVANLAKVTAGDRMLVEAANDYLASPDVADLDDDKLIAYLAFPKNKIPPGTRDLLVKEAIRRADAATIAVARLIAEQFNPDTHLPFTCRRLVRAALEIRAWEKIRVELQDAAGAGVAPQSIGIDLGDETPGRYSRAYKKLMFQHLSDKLRMNDDDQIGTRTRTEPLFSRLIEEQDAADLAPLAARDQDEMDEALSDFLPDAGNWKRGPGLQRLTVGQENTLRTMLLEHISQAASSRKVAENSQEFPVCSQFLRDTTQAHLAVNGVLIPKIVDARVPMQSVSRGQAYLNAMRKLRNISDAQIFMASRVANQSIANVFSDFVLQEKLCSLSVDEMEAGNLSGAAIASEGLLPADLQFDENVFMKANGNLVIRVHAVQKNIREWKGADISEVTVHTDENASSFMAELNLEINREGEILEELSAKISFERMFSAQRTFQVAGLAP
ncbi:hypothetical protein [Noviherbaspirillum suwonense]|uniref:Uncharacterized protein n=1 Tax=Noviherbaspirillum suwonense TaxID=1224511 RepID=A0ABY1Q0T1_9BURK|nr:hypothetical protein [Noviherbaspirillum suwonense]SMP52911.1 hypothetical protein SAMN06295970_103213 [Noviherbaspirillum suwonense]